MYSHARACPLYNTTSSNQTDTASANPRPPLYHIGGRQGNPPSSSSSSLLVSPYVC